MTKISTLLIITILFVLLCSSRLEKNLLPSYFPKPRYDFVSNPLKKDIITLGRRLFYDPILSKNNTLSCASCHSPYNAFAHVDHELSHGIYDRIGIRNAPALFNLAWAPYFMLDGAIHHLDMQALAPLSDSNEMNNSIEMVLVQLNKDASYQQQFKQYFRDSTITGEHFLKAIAQFMLSLVSAESKYDSVMRGEAQFTAQENNGYQLFQKHCNSCHQAPLFTNYEFVNTGLTENSAIHDYGRFRITKNENDSFKFKVPSLRNITFTYPYMHDGRHASLKEVLKFYTTTHTFQKNTDIRLQKPMPISANEQVDIISFLLCLSDKKFIFNNKHAFPKSMLKNE
jgi:cytochrome c peroxidase